MAKKKQQSKARKPRVSKHEKLAKELVARLPNVHPDLWGDSEWDTVEAIMQGTPPEVGDLIWDFVTDRWYKDSGVHDRSAQDLTDDEMKQLTRALAQYGDGTAVSATAGDNPEEDYDQFPIIGGPDPKIACTCKGPGSKEGEFKSHTQSCPCWFKGTKYDTNPYVDCNCQGPGARDMRFNSHTAQCPCFTSTGATGSTYTHKSCKHMLDTFELMDGLKVFASAHRDRKPYSTKPPKPPFLPDLGVYAYNGWSPAVTVSPGLTLPWSVDATPSMTIDWQDYGLPYVSDELMVDILRWMLAEIDSGKRVEVGCMGGHGRTGSLLALLLVAQGVLPGTAISKVRKEYCEDAIEGHKQVVYIRDMHEVLFGKEWRQNKPELELWKGLEKAEHKSYSTGYSYSAPKNQNEKKGSEGGPIVYPEFPGWL